MPSRPELPPSSNSIECCGKDMFAPFAGLEGLSFVICNQNWQLLPQEDTNQEWMKTPHFRGAFLRAGQGGQIRQCLLWVAWLFIVSLVSGLAVLNVMTKCIPGFLQGLDCDLPGHPYPP